MLLVNDFLSVRLAEVPSLRCAGAQPGPGFAGCRTSAAGLQFQRVPLGATTIQTIINHRPTPPRLLLKPNTIKKSPQGPNLPGYVNDFLVKVVETPSLRTFKTPLQKALVISVLGNNPVLAEGSNKEDFVILGCPSSLGHHGQRHHDFVVSASDCCCRFS